MTHLLLLGAGFSRNWGGWLATEAFEYLLGHPKIISNPSLRDLLWKHQQDGGGFEEALAEVQRDHRRDPKKHQTTLNSIQGAIKCMFDDMNKAFLKLPSWEFQNGIDGTVNSFLNRFDAIFTLNQDLLLEHHYMSIGRNPEKPAYFPGMERIPSSEPSQSHSWAHSSFFSEQPDNFKLLDSSHQPIFKLHGSSNWRHTQDDATSLLVMGGGKKQNIDNTPILNWYATEFEQRLAQPKTRLMIIGYGFRDQHINEMLKGAVQKGLEIFVIAPEGAEIAMKQNPTRHSGCITGSTPLEETIKQSLIGASRRPLNEIFGSNTMEHNKVMRFFELPLK